MIINSVQFNCNLEDILTELQQQLRLNHIELIQKTVDSGNDIMIQCPYHGNGQERRPSAGIRKSDGLFHCFACQETHSLQEVISHCFGHDDPFGKFGWTWLLKNFATIQVEERKDVELDFRRNQDSRKFDSVDAFNNSNTVSGPYNNIDSQVYVSEEELDRYRFYHPYWEKRGITDERIIELFDLGYDKTAKCITMPIRDTDGNTVFVARRSVSTKWFNYPQGVHKPLYGLYEYNLQSDRMNEVFICESMIDALLLWQSGYQAVAMNGLGSTSQIETLQKLPVRKYILCTDNDKAGQTAREVLRKSLKNKILTEIQFPPNRKDVGECTEEEIKNILDWEIF